VLNTGKPKEITSRMSQPMFIFTDASFEPSDKEWPAGLGGVLYSEDCVALEHFSHCLTPAELKVMGFPEDKQTVIFETEVLAIIVALQVWCKRVDGRPVVIFVDNNSARDVAVSGTARTKVPLLLVSTLLALEDDLQITPWYARVPSKSNPADEPLDFLGATTPCDKLEETVRSILSRLA
jgi:hypothetical protein